MSNFTFSMARYSLAVCAENAVKPQPTNQPVAK